MRFVEETIAVPTEVGDLAGILRRPEPAVHLPGVVLVDGSGPGTADGWGGWPEWVGDCGAVVLRHDKPECGASPGDWREQDFESRADESLAAARVLRAANGGGPVGLAGFSQGGWVALLAAARNPDAVDFVVSVSGPGVTPKRQERARIERDLRRRELDEAERQDALAWVDERADRLLAGELVAAILADQERARDRPWYEAVTFGAYEDAGTLGFAARILDFDPLPVAARVRCPVLVLLGERTTWSRWRRASPPSGPCSPGSARGRAGWRCSRTGTTGCTWPIPIRTCPTDDRGVSREHRCNVPRPGDEAGGRGHEPVWLNRDVGHPDSFGARDVRELGGRKVELFRLDALQARYDVLRLPYTLRILLENVLRREDGVTVTPRDVEAVAGWVASAEPSQEVSFTPGRVLLQDFTGVPAIVDLAAMRDAMRELGGDPARINPLLPAELVIDHSVQVDEYATRLAIFRNAELEFERNRERYAFLRWGQGAFDNLAVVPPSTGIVHQVNLEFLARVVDERDGVAFPDTLVGTDSHTTMVNGLGVLGWGVGGIEAEAAMLGEAISMLVPQVVGFKLMGALPEGATATDLVLTVTEVLRETGVVGKFVEYFGHGLEGLPLADRATIGNMSPEYGATCGFFPVDAETIRYLRLTGRPEERVALVEAYCKENALWHDPEEPPVYSQVVELDLSTVEPSLAGPRRPQDRVALPRAKQAFLDALPTFGVDYGNAQDAAVAESFPASDPPATMEPGASEPEGEGAVPILATAEAVPRRGVACELDGERFELSHGSVVIAAITSCTNTSNPAVMVAAGLLAKKAVERGLRRQPWVKSSLAPGSKVVTRYYDKAGLTQYLEELGFYTVGYGCTTCIGNSGPLPEPISKAVADGDLVVCAVLSGNRNFEARIHGEVKANYLGSPPLVVAYALAGRMDVDLTSEPIGVGSEGEDVYLSDIWPTAEEVRETVAGAIGEEMFRETYADVYTGDETWRMLPVPDGDLFAWDPASTYVRRPPYFDGMAREPEVVEDLAGARCLVSIGDSVTTDHISPAGAIRPDSPAGRYLIEHGVERREFNSYGSRRGNHEVMVRGTFANVRLRNLLVPGSEGTWTVHVPSGEETTIFEAAERYRAEGVPLIVLAGKEYGSGSSRDWAAKGPGLLGVRAVIAESYERIHRSNLLMMGVLPLQFLPGESRGSLGLTGLEEFAIEGLENGEARQVTVRADGTEFGATVRLDTPREREYLRHGGILPFVLRRLLAS